jgi:transcriptional regulator NrdR family protein
MTTPTALIVVKRNSEREAFSYDKLISSFLKAGIPMQNAEEMSKNVQNWIMENVKAGEIESSVIRDKIIEVMSKDFPGEADSYQTYVKG